MRKIHIEPIEEIFKKRKLQPQDLDIKNIHEDCIKIENELKDKIE